jgi:hypothetical protein
MLPEADACFPVFQDSGRLNSEHQAGANRSTIEDDRACSAYAMLASHVGSCELDFMADKVTQQHPGFNHPLV